MALKQRLVNEEEDNLTKNVDDLDAAYIIRMKEQGLDESLIEQFASLLSLDGQNEDEGENAR